MVIDTDYWRFAAWLAVASGSWSIVVRLWVSQRCSILIIAVSCRSCIVVVGCLGRRSISGVSLCWRSISGIGLRWTSWSSETIGFAWCVLLTKVELRQCLCWLVGWFVEVLVEYWVSHSLARGWSLGWTWTNGQ